MTRRFCRVSATHTSPVGRSAASKTWPYTDVHGNGIPRGNGNPVGFPWESHEIGKQISMGTGMISVGVGMLENAL